MYRIIFSVLFVLLIFNSTPVKADHCPRDISTAMNAVQNTKWVKKRGLSKTNIRQINGLIQKGRDLHKSRHHKKALAALHEALDMLGIKKHK